MAESQKFVVWNNIDNIATHPGAFDTKKEAEQFSKEFVKRFQKQGYYRDNNWNKISLEELPNYLQVIKEEDFMNHFISNHK